MSNHPLAVSQSSECGGQSLPLRDVIVPAAPAHVSAISHVFTRNAPGITLPVSSTMTLSGAARSLTPALRRLTYRQARTILPRQFSASAHSPPKSSDTPWIVRLRHVFSLLSCPQLFWRVLIDRVCACLHPDGRSSNVVYVSHTQCIYKLSFRSDICSRLLRAPNHITRTVLLIMESPVLPRRTFRLQSLTRYAT